MAVDELHRLPRSINVGKDGWRRRGTCIRRGRVQQRRNKAGETGVGREGRERFLDFYVAVDVVVFFRARIKQRAPAGSGEAGIHLQGARGAQKKETQERRKTRMKTKRYEGEKLLLY
ncbi:hypothetical protein TEQG_01011 [Trichophyton equinum CBS 127.97]|uniref:Uncharacterized protein n=1 Tax=Trichophyton equinum (strain ATCC MYA-4606 / CBS 127.97) TaxID=559882 RepID=F2PJA3_TRIEC|nr:hypothetical protein TEQG_01011 [Trichophyton equinum CBS 127.97]